MSPSAATDFRNRIEQLGDLPTLPHVVQKLASMIGRPNVSAGEIGSLIEKYQVLAAKVLRLANAWHLPATLRKPIPYHHQPGAAQDAQRGVCL
jgi:HD-like signal output (HDOD) protein